MSNPLDDTKVQRDLELYGPLQEAMSIIGHHLITYGEDYMEMQFKLNGHSIRIVSEKNND